MFLPADRFGRGQFRIALLVRGGLRARRLGAAHRRLGLLQSGLQVGVIQTHQHLPRFDFLAGLEIDLLDAGHQPRADAGLVDGPDRSDRRFGSRQPDQTDRHRRPRDGRRRGGAGSFAHRHLGRELPGQPKQEDDDRRGEAHKHRRASGPLQPLFSSTTSRFHGRHFLRTRIENRAFAPPAFGRASVRAAVG
jgi:hypothetical protein